MIPQLAVAIHFTDPCKGVVCMIEGEICDPVVASSLTKPDAQFQSSHSSNVLENREEFNVAAHAACRCGNTTQTCVGNPAASLCNFINGTCMCGKAHVACSGATPWCIDNQCRCSKYTKSYVQGNGTTQGSCEDECQACMADGTCQGKNVIFKAVETPLNANVINAISNLHLLFFQIHLS